MSKQLGNKSFEVDAARLNVLLGGGGASGGNGSNFAVPISGYDNTSSTNLFYGAGGIWMDGAVNTDFYGVWRVPADYSGGAVSVSVALSMSSSGTVTGKLIATRERCNSNVVTDSPAYSDVAVTKSGATRLLNCVYQRTISSSLSLQAGDLVRFNFDRAGTVGSGTDTGESGYLVAFLISA